MKTVELAASPTHPALVRIEMELLAQMSWPQWFVSALLIGVCGLLMIVILLQRGRGGGLAGAFGGGGGTAAFGAKTGDVFTWITVGFATVFVLLAVVANFALDETPGKKTKEQPAEVTTTVPIDVTLPDGTPAPGAAPKMDVQSIKLDGTPVEPGSAPTIKYLGPSGPDGKPPVTAIPPPATTPAGEPPKPAEEKPKAAEEQPKPPVEKGADEE